MIPAGLSARSRRLWREITEEYRLQPGEMLIFEQQLHTLDELAELEKIKAEVVERGELFTTTNTGQVRPHPVLAEARALRELLQKQAMALDFPMPEHDFGGKKPHKPCSGASKRAQKAAQARWGTGGGAPSAG
jgi:hypothetical protein